MNITIPISTITKTIAIVPEWIRSTVNYAGDIYPILVAQVGASPEELINLINGIMTSDEDGDGCDDENCSHQTPLSMWEAGRRGLEIITIIRSKNDFPIDQGEALAAALNDVDSPQHAVDTIMALANMLAVTLDEEDVAKFASMFLEWEAEATAL